MRLYVDGRPKCGAALIGENAAVTAAHCVVND
jgi:V8-like Glu-specific endopeptidase